MLPHLAIILLLFLFVCVDLNIDGWVVVVSDSSIITIGIGEKNLSIGSLNWFAKLFVSTVLIEWERGSLSRRVGFW